MKKNVIALLLSFVLATGSIGTAPVYAAETTAEEASVVEDGGSVEEEAHEDIEDSDIGLTVSEADATKEEKEEPVEEEQKVEETSEEQNESAEITVPEEIADDEEAEDSVDEGEINDDGTESAEMVVIEEETGTEEENEASQAGDVVDSGTCGENAIWTMYKNHLLVVSGTGEMENFVNSTSVYTAPWKSLKDDIYEVVIEDGITSIGDYSFWYFDEILSISIPNSVRRIGNGAFIGCTGLTSVVIPDSVTEIGYQAFYDCSEITEINIPDHAVSIGDAAYGGISKWEVDLYLSDSITYLGRAAFSGCNGVRSVRIPHTIDAIRDSTFTKCGITKIDIPENITSIGNLAFSQTQIKEINIPGTVKTIGEMAFYYCRQLETVVLSTGVESIGVRCFWECNMLSQLSLPEGITEIPEGAFAGTTSLRVVTIPEGVTKIGYCAFENGGLVLIEIPETVKIISAFSTNYATILVYYGTQKHWDKIQNDSDRYKKLYCVTTRVTDVELDRDRYVVGVGNSLSIDPHIYPNDASCQLMEWFIDDPEIASVSTSNDFDKSRTIKGLKTGTTTLTGVSIDGDYTVTCSIEVVSNRVLGIFLPDSGSEQSIGIGRSKQITASVIPADAVNKNIIWSSSDPDIVTVDNEGNITGVSKGTATVTATTEDGRFSASCTVTTHIAVSDFTLSETAITVTKGSSKKIAITIEPDDADDDHRVLNIDDPSNNTFLLYLYGGNPQTLSIRGKYGGQSRIKISTEDGSVNKYIDVTVIVPVTKISLSKTFANMHVGDKLQLQATVSPSDATNKTISWSSSNEEVATVDENGEVTAYKLGDTTIKAVAGAHSATCKISVIIPATGIELNKSSVNIPENSTVTLKATVSPEDAGDKSVVWKSSDDKTAIVDKNGVVTAVNAGNATISATTNDGGYTASCDVVVDHVWNAYYSVDKEATCTEEGSESIHCSVCDAIDDTTVRLVPMKEHTYGDWTITKEPTCIEEGSKEKICAECRGIVSEVVPANGHAWNEEVTIDKEATCAAEGSESVHCSVCDAIDESTIAAIPKKEHRYGGWTVTRKATCTGEGSRKRTCFDCGDIATEVIPANGHYWYSDYTIDKAATCVAEGSKSIHCSVCDSIDETTICSIPKKEHKYGDWSISKEVTCTSAGSKERECANCGNKDKEIIPATGHKWEKDYTVDVEATCSKEGSESMHCSVCDAINEATVYAIPKKEHKYTDWTVTKEASCTGVGSKERVCADCGAKAIERIPANGHIWNEDYTIDKEPTATEEGVKSIHCSVCNVLKEGSVVIIPKPAKELSEVMITEIVNKTYTGKEITQNVVIKDGRKQLIAGADYSISYENNINTRTASVIITGVGSYTGTVTKNFLILPGKTSRGDMFNLANNVKVTWKEVPGAKYYKVYREGITNPAESLDEPVIVTTGLIGWDKQSGLTNGNAYRYRIVASLTKDSTGDSTLSYSKVMYRLKTVVIRSVKNTEPGKVTVKYDKTTSGDSYVLQYCEREDMVGAKTKVVLGANNTSYTIGGLKKGRTYYISIRVRKKVNGIDYYTTFGVPKKIKITQ